jgi:hypothetical protein
MRLLPLPARLAAWALALCAILLASGCATTPATKEAAPAPRVAPGSVLDSLAVDPSVQERLLALDPEHINEQDIKTTLSRVPAPRIILIHGGVYGTNLILATFARFLVDMGYPEAKIRDPVDHEYSYSPYGSSEQIAGAIAWYYEHEGVRPMLIGHSQGGIQAIKILYELVGSYRDKIAVWNPITGAAENRFSITDPLTGAQRPVVGGVSVSYASVVGAGGIALLLPNQWSMVGRLHSIPESVEDFTGFSLGLDLVAWDVTFTARSPYHHNGTAVVRNVRLPATYNHVFVPLTERVNDDKRMRDWVNAFVPGADNPEPPGQAEGKAYNALWIGDVWFSIKKHWCLEAQRLIRARRTAIDAR